MTAPSSMDLTAAQSTAASRWDFVLNVSTLPCSTPVSDGHVWYFDTPPDTRLVEDVPTRPMKFREGFTLAPLASLLNVDSRSQIALEQPRVTFSAPVLNSKREDSVRLHPYHRTGIMSSVPSSIQLQPSVRSAETVGDSRHRSMHREAQTPTPQHTVSLVPNSALKHNPGWKYRPITKTLTFEDSNVATEYAPIQPRRRSRYNASPEIDSDDELMQRRLHRTEETRQKRRSSTEDKAVNTMRRHLDRNAQSDRISSSGLSGNSKKVNQSSIEDPLPRTCTKQRRPQCEPFCSNSDSGSSSDDSEEERHRGSEPSRRTPSRAGSLDTSNTKDVRPSAQHIEHIIFAYAHLMEVETSKHSGHILKTAPPTTDGATQIS